MTDWLNYKGIEVPDATPSGAAGLRLKEDLQALVDWSPKSKWDATADPTTSDDDTDDYYPGSFWLNTTSDGLFVCLDNATGAADWRPVGGGSAAGSDTQVQFNDGGDFGADADLTFDKSSGELTIGNLQIDGPNNTIRSTDTDGPIIISPNGNGAIQADSGGNARGDHAVDLQSVRSSATQVASGKNAVVSGGRSNRASGSYSSICGGIANIASGSYSTVGGGGRYGGSTSNIASGQSSTIGGGTYNLASALYATVGGGGGLVYGNRATGIAATIAGGNVNLASGHSSTVGGGALNIASGAKSFVGGGQYNSATGAYSFVSGGTNGVATLQYQMAHAAGRFNSNGDAQFTRALLRRATSNATVTELTLNGATPTSGNRFTIDDERVYSCFVRISGRRDTGSDQAFFLRQLIIERTGGTVALEGGVQTVGTDINPGGWSISITADNTNKSLKIDVTGAASTIIRWLAVVEALEISHMD